jgi:hypothetical protein
MYFVHLISSERRRLKYSAIAATDNRHTTGSVTFWYGYGSSNPWSGLDPAPYPDPGFFSGFQDVNKNKLFSRLFFFFLTAGTFSSVLKAKKSLRIQKGEKSRFFLIVFGLLMEG